MDEFLILLQAKLDEAKSKENVNTDIDKIQSQLDKLKIQAEIDPKAAKKLVDSIGKLINQKIVISNIDVDTKSATKSGQDYGKQFSQGLSQELKNNTSKLATFKKSLENIGMGYKEIDTIANKINNLGVQIETLNQARSSGKKDILSVNIAGIDQYGQAIKLTQQYNIATGELVNAIDAVSTAQQGIGNNTNSIKKAENIFADYTAKMEQFKSTNSNILSGLSDPLSDFENKLSGLKTGSASIDDVVNSYKNLNSEASKITSNLSAQFNKVDSAVRNIAKGDETIASLRADFKGLSNAPKEVNSELSKCEKLLLNVKNIETQEGRTVNWSAAYKEWEQSLDSLKAKIATLKKEQSNVASSQIFNTKDLDSQGKIYIQKVNNTIKKTKAELESKLRNAGYMDIQIKGTEDAAGKIKSLTATVTDATGAFKQLNFERAKIQNSGKAQAGFVQTDDVKVIGNISSSIDKVQSNLSSLKTKWEEQGVLVGEFKTKVEQLESSLSSIGSKGELNSLKTQIQDLKSEASTIAQINKIQLSMDNGSYDKQLSSLVASYERLGLTSDEIKAKTNDVYVALDKLKEKNFNTLESDAKNFANELKKSQNEATILKNDLENIYNPKKQTKLSTDIQNWLSKNSRASKEAKESLNAYYRELNDGRVSVDRLNYIEQELKSIDATQRGLGKLGKNLKDQFKEASTSFTQWLSVSSGIMTLIYQLQKMPKEVIKVNSAMVELNKVSDASALDIVKYYDEAVKSAKRYGSSVSDLISATADWSRLGYSLPDSKKLAEVATLYKNVGDGIDISTANESLVSTLQGFKLEANDAMHIIDAFNEVGNNFAIGSDGIGEALKRSASSMYAAGNTLEETIGLVTAANAVVQDPDSIGTAYKTISMRIRGAKTEMEELGLETDGMVESTATLQKEIMALSGVDIMKDKDTFKSTYQILDELATKWTDLTDIQQASITELIAGKRQGNIVSALMSNFETARLATESAINSTGSALKEQEAYEQGIQYSLDRLEASFQAFANHILDSNFLKGIIDFGNGTINVIDTVTDKLGSLGTIGLGAGLFSSIKNVGRDKMYSLICYLF